VRLFPCPIIALLASEELTERKTPQRLFQSAQAFTLHGFDLFRDMDGRSRIEPGWNGCMDDEQEILGQSTFVTLKTKFPSARRNPGKSCLRRPLAGSSPHQEDATGSPSPVTGLCKKTSGRPCRMDSNQQRRHAGKTDQGSPPQIRKDFHCSSTASGLRDFHLISKAASTWKSRRERIKDIATRRSSENIFSFYPPEDLVRQTRNSFENCRARSRYEDAGWRVRKDGSASCQLVITALQTIGASAVSAR